MVLVSFQVDNKLGRASFFQKIFSLAKSSIDVILSYINDQIDTNSWLKRICSKSSNTNWKSFYNLHGLCQLKIENVNPSDLKSSDRFFSGLEKLLF